MRVLLVIAQINYVPTNGFDFLKLLLANQSDEIAGVIIVTNFTVKTLLVIRSFYKIGARNLGRHLLKNVLELPLRKRERLCKKYSIPVITTDNINSENVLKFITAHQIDLVINRRTRKKFSKQLLKQPQYGCLNIHPGILPTYKGLYCDLYALFEQRRAGFSIHTMTDEIDEGKILCRQFVSEKNERDYCQYLRKAAGAEVQALSAIITRIKLHHKLPKPIRTRKTIRVYTRIPSGFLMRYMIDSGFIL